MAWFAFVVVLSTEEQVGLINLARTHLASCRHVLFALHVYRMLTACVRAQPLAPLYSDQHARAACRPHHDDQQVSVSAESVLLLCDWVVNNVPIASSLLPASGVSMFSFRLSVTCSSFKLVPNVFVFVLQPIWSF
jgi:hypothetical protein